MKIAPFRHLTNFDFDLGFAARQDYFTHFEPCQSLGWVKTGDPREKTPDNPQAEFGLSYMWPELDSNPQRFWN